MTAASSRDKQITIDGNTWTLRMSIKAVLRLKDHWGLKSDDEVVRRLNKPGITDVADLVWAGLSTHHPDVPHEKVIEAIDNEGLGSVADSVNKAIAGAVASEYGDQGPPAQGAAEDAP
ncbi:hypothetical protein TVVG_00015 [Tetraselmis viridis virus SI1]|uniref:hypothetical protein n=1 Tax=Tetraselmis viridis virus S20 TaxID=754070 RepID=UPI0002C09F69|nr:hypothetical protein TVGG_00036 [Tetraselmis viridis virus S20]AGH31364.1 hypothetical protein TVGG_00036 [Tetraselmis viridis virus S20]AGH31398.1 hypothetical protein TVVG_00015 [Tetraselmis viridis virus SI1]